jgi:diaminopropionate ammonia-lyase
MRLLMNPLRGRGLSNPETLVAGETATDPTRALALLSSCPVYSATPLLARDGLAKSLGLSSLHIKDERSRMGLGSFKALGASFAIAALAEERKGAKLLQPGVASEALEGETFVTASAGNHGLSVTAGARIFGAQAVIYLPETAPMGFAGRLRDRGAEVIIKGADYEGAMAAAAEAAAINGWRLLSDSTWDDYDVGRSVMEGYLAMGAEAADQIPTPPTHIFLQAGVGGLAAAMAAYFRSVWGDSPIIAVVEPTEAACLLESIKADGPAHAPGEVSNMGRLDCKDPSHIALKSLARDADAFIAVTDEYVQQAVDFLMDDGLPTSPSGGGGFAGLMAARADQVLGLNTASRTLVILSEAPSDD